MHEKKLDLNADPQVWRAAATFQLRLAQFVTALQSFYGSAAVAEESEWATQQETLAQAVDEAAAAMMGAGMEFLNAVRSVTRGRLSDETRLMLLFFQPPPLPSSAFSWPMQSSTEKTEPTQVPRQWDI